MRKKRLKRIFISSLVLLLASPVVLFYLVSEDVPNVLSGTENLDPASAKNARMLIKQLRDGVLSTDASAEFKANETELNHLVSLISRGTERVNGRINLSQLGIYVVFSVYTPENPFGDFLNFSTIVLPSTKGLQLDNVQVGNITIPGGLSKSLAEFVLNRVLGEELGSRVISSIRQLSIHKSTMKAMYTPIPDLKEQLGVFRGRVKFVRNELQLGGDPKKVRIYFEKICQLDKAANVTIKHSFERYLSDMLNFTYLQASDTNVSDEYRSAVLALAIYFGTDKFESIIGPVRTEELSHCLPNHKIVLGGRRDLLQHFIVSAGLRVLAENGIPFAIGEFKELLDSQTGGSGFSFVDLAADRAGLRFADHIIEFSNNKDMAKLDFSNKKEADYFPDTRGLPEGMSKDEFKRFYQDVNSVMYDLMLKDIDKRISQLSLYQ